MVVIVTKMVILSHFTKFCDKNYYYFVTALNFVVTICDKITFDYSMLIFYAI